MIYKEVAGYHTDDVFNKDKNMAKRADYDSPWKDLVEKYFQQFMEFFFPVFSLSDWRSQSVVVIVVVVEKGDK
ncbi:MAG: hypothetical protein GQF41_0508 [Candidatus Rifleibacterium amylolyticum]|nr:MAG: hypothetical protein GQF41_0508 [Candidatus Rifleibacterium amylolyticum]